MKKLILILVCLGVGGILAYSLPWIRSARAARPLYGTFDIQMKCMGGHEIFLELDGASAYDNCPGHRDRKRVGRVVRDANTATIVDLRDEQPWFRIEWDGSKHVLVFLKRSDSSSIFGMIPVRGAIQQVTNPWRLWLPRLQPEH